jgi:WD40 repeat protein
MESINVIDGPELNNKNIEISTICYLKNLSLVAVGTDLGKIFFWDLNKSIYLKNDYENFFRHKSFVTCIVNIGPKNGKEYVISSGLEGLILIWEIEAVEVKDSRNRGMKLANLDDDKIKKLEKLQMLNEQIDPQLRLPIIDPRKVKVKLSNYMKYIPQIKAVINTSLLLKQFTEGYKTTNEINEVNINTSINDSQINVLAFSDLFPNYIFSGGVDCSIHIWDYEKNDIYKSLQGHSTPISSIIFDKHFLISASLDGQIILWNTHDFTSLMSLNEPGLFRVVDLMMMPKYGLLVSITTDKKLNFWKYEAKQLIKSINLKHHCLCFAIVESYGKLLCGTKDKTIIEFDLTEILGSLNISHDYQKFHFKGDGVNYQKDESKYFLK